MTHVSVFVSGLTGKIVWFELFCFNLRGSLQAVARGGDKVESVV